MTTWTLLANDNVIMHGRTELTRRHLQPQSRRRSEVRTELPWVSKLELTASNLASEGRQKMPTQSYPGVET